jgi:hypothetical protein
VSRILDRTEGDLDQVPAAAKKEIHVITGLDVREPSRAFARKQRITVDLHDRVTAHQYSGAGAAWNYSEYHRLRAERITDLWRV